MRVFVAGGSGVIGRRLVPQLVANGHEVTALSEAHSGQPDLRRADRFFAITNRLRSEGVDHLLAAAEATGVSHVVMQGHASMNGVRTGGWVKTEEDPLEVIEGTKAINRLEETVVDAGGGSCGTARSTGRAPTTTRSGWCGDGCSRSSARAPDTSPGCTSRTQRAPPSSRWNRR